MKLGLLDATTKIKKPRKRPIQREDELLSQFFQWLQLQYPKVYEVTFHPANERKTSPQAGARLKRKGVKSGVPDVVMPYRTAKHPGLFAEFKVKGNKLTETQSTYLNKVKAQGFHTTVWYSIEQAQTELKQYLQGL